MPLYENVFIVRQDASTQQVEGMTDHFSGIVRDQGGEVAKTEHWGLKTMAYRIKKNRKGHYVMMNLDAARRQSRNSSATSASTRMSCAT